MMFGRYRDVLQDDRGRIALDTGWRANTIVDTAWPLLAALLRNDKRFRGILYWAVGTGDAQWDASPPSPGDAVDRLHAEVGRVRIDPAWIRYLDQRGRPRTDPTPTLDIRALFTRRQADQELREFGVVGGDATDNPNTGRLINYVVHPPLRIPRGRRLLRRLHLAFQSELQEDAASVPAHWISGIDVENLDGVGSSVAAVLKRARLDTIGKLAASEPQDFGRNLTLKGFLDLQRKARLAIRAAAAVGPVISFADTPVGEVLSKPVAALAADYNESEAVVTDVSERIGLLDMTLKSRFLAELTVGRLAESGPPPQPGPRRPR